MTQKPSLRNRFAQFLKNYLVAENPLYNDPYRSTVLKGVALKPYAQISETEKETHRAIVECIVTSQHPKDSPEFLKELMDKLVSPFKFDNRDNLDLRVLLTMAKRAATEQDYTPWSFDTEDLISIAKEIEKKRLWSTTAEDYWRRAKNDLSEIDPPVCVWGHKSVIPKGIVSNTLWDKAMTDISITDLASPYPKLYQITEPGATQTKTFCLGENLVRDEFFMRMWGTVSGGVSELTKELYKAYRDYRYICNIEEEHSRMYEFFKAIGAKERLTVYNLFCGDTFKIELRHPDGGSIFILQAKDNFCKLYVEMYEVFYKDK